MANETSIQDGASHQDDISLINKTFRDDKIFTQKQRQQQQDGNGVQVYITCIIFAQKSLPDSDNRAIYPRENRSRLN